MESPFPKSSSSAGDGCIIARSLPAGGTGIETLTFQYPLKLISPSSRVNEKSALVFLLSYGGGLVGGDHVNLSIEVKKGARLSIVTQGNTKIFKSPSPTVSTRQTLHVYIEEEGAFCLLPDPVQPFEQSVYAQTQIFKAAKASSLCLLDWVSQGRAARGEDWSFVSWTGRNEVWLTGLGTTSRSRLLVRDLINLSAKDSLDLGRPLKETMHKLGVFGTLILRGDLMQPLGEFFLSEFTALPRIGSRDFRTEEDRRKEDDNMTDHKRWRTRRLEMEKHKGILWSAAQVRGCVVVKMGCSTVEAGRDWLSSMLVREGTVEDVFGDQALMCLR